ncbi:MAG: hypothetical protein KF774_13675 [Planctomyces sp.]|nr:hypothetical protein [Planctomyces sp.]
MTSLLRASCRASMRDANRLPARFGLAVGVAVAVVLVDAGAAHAACGDHLSSRLSRIELTSPLSRIEIRADAVPAPANRMPLPLAPRCDGPGCQNLPFEPTPTAPAPGSDSDRLPCMLTSADRHAPRRPALPGEAGARAFALEGVAWPIFRPPESL